MNVSIKPNSESILHGEWARFISIAGRLCIDFTQTGGETEKRAYWERFHQPSDLGDWLAESALQLQGIRVTPEEFQIGLSLREAIWRAAQAIRQNEIPPAEDVDMINRVAAAADLSPQLDQKSFQETWHGSATATAALSTIARDAIDLFSSGLRSRIRQCPNLNCGLMFVDASRSRDLSLANLLFS